MKINYPLLKIKIKHFFNLETEAEKAAIEDAFIRSQKERMEHIQNLCQHQIHISDDTIDANTQQMPDGSYLIGKDSPESRSSFCEFWHELWQAVNIFQSRSSRSLHRWIFSYNHSNFVAEVKSLGSAFGEILLMIASGAVIVLLVWCFK